LQRIPDFQQTSFAIFPPLMIPEPKRLNALFGQKLFADFVTLDSFRQAVLKSIQFDSQFCIGAREIQNMFANGMLPAKFETGEASSMQCPPEFLFFVGLITAKLAGDWFEAHAGRMRKIIGISSSSPRPSPRLARRGRRNAVNSFVPIPSLASQSFFSSEFAN
jgi:hypothetical protein